MKNSIQKLTKISDTLSSHQVYYKYNKMEIENLSLSYRKGRVNAAKWLNDLIYYYIEKESRFINEFKEQIQEQKKTLSELEDNEFKEGLFDELNLIEDKLNDRTNK